MDFSLSDEQQRLVDTARKFTREKIIPVAQKLDEHGTFPKEICEQAWEIGLMNAELPQEVGGLELAVACDMIFASEHARMGLPEVTLGVTPGFGGTQRLVRLVGKLRAKEMIFTGDWVDAKRAYEIGLANAVLPREKLLEHCRSVAQKIAQKGPLAVARAKRLVERGYDMTLRAANRQEAESFALLFDTEDRREGMRAFVEKRPAKFTGK